MILDYLKDKSRDDILGFFTEFIDHLQINYGVDEEIQNTVFERVVKNKPLLPITPLGNDEIVKWLKTNCVNDNNDLVLIGLDLTDVRDVFFCDISTSRDMYLSYQNVGRNLIQQESIVKGTVTEGGHTKSKNV